MNFSSLGENMKEEAHCVVIVLGLSQRTNAVGATDFWVHSVQITKGSRLVSTREAENRLFVARGSGKLRN